MSCCGSDRAETACDTTCATALELSVGVPWIIALDIVVTGEVGSEPPGCGMLGTVCLVTAVPMADGVVPEVIVVPDAGGAVPDADWSEAPA